MPLDKSITAAMRHGNSATAFLYPLTNSSFFLAITVISTLLVATASSSEVWPSSTVPFRLYRTQQNSRLEKIFMMMPSFIKGSFPVRWDVLASLATCMLLSAILWTKRNNVASKPAEDRDADLLKKHSSIESYTTLHTTYPSIRTFFHPHPRAERLPKEPHPLPVLIFVHGLGGQLAQFLPLLNSLTNVAPCFGIDFPGCGLSEPSPRDKSVYSHFALTSLLDVVIGKACELAGTGEAILICHSMGCSLAVSLLAEKDKSRFQNASMVQGLIVICPRASKFTVEELKMRQRLVHMPNFLFDLFRARDRRGGIDSVSVARIVGSSASAETKKMQLRYNESSRTDVFLRTTAGMFPSTGSDGSLSGGLPGPEQWATVAVPMLVIAGESDQLTSPKEVAVILQAMGRTPTHDRAAALDKPAAHISSEDSSKAALKTIILPAPASHGLMYDHATYRTVSGLILAFLADHIDPHLSLGWQLQYLKDANKWDVKNLRKWQAVVSVSEPIAGIFRAMKTLRNSDEEHSPANFVKKWAGSVKGVIDISRDSPVYDPHELEQGGIEYHKFPTVSKIPPNKEEVRGFIALVDQLRLEENSSESDRLIGVHCHYGFNRTGFFMCSYLVEREGYGIQKAIDEFAAKRPDGIRHEHFLGTLFERYCVGIKRAPTM